MSETAESNMFDSDAFLEVGRQDREHLPFGSSSLLRSGGNAAERIQATAGPSGLASMIHRMFCAVQTWINPARASLM